MRVCFVTPPCEAVSTADLAPPLWAMVLGACAADAGWFVFILDLNLQGLDRTVDTDHAGAFYPAAIEQIRATEPTLVAISSMGVNSHVALELAKRLKDADAAIRVVLGGPHLGAIAREAMQRYPWVDGITVGEGERPLRSLLMQFDDWTNGADVAVAGMVLRTRHGINDHGQRQTPAPEEIPTARYSLTNLAAYFRVNPRRLLNFDAAQRGCRFSCGYCYAPMHFGVGHRPAPVERFVAEWAEAKALGANRLFVVQDNFVNSPPGTIALCRELAALRVDLTFHCYSTLAQLTTPVANALAAAGCRGVYVGVDAVHEAEKKRYAKNLYSDEPDLMHKAQECLALGIVPTLSFVVDVVDSPASKEIFEETFAVAAQARAAGFPIRLNTLLLYNGAAEFQKFAGSFTHSETKSRLTMDAPEVVLRNELAEAAPHLFPFHSTHRPLPEQERFLLGVQALFTLVNVYPEQMLRFAQNRVAWDLAATVTQKLGSADIIPLDVHARAELYTAEFRKLVRGARRSDPITLEGLAVP